MNAKFVPKTSCGVQKKFLLKFFLTALENEAQCHYSPCWCKCRNSLLYGTIERALAMTSSSRLFMKINELVVMSDDYCITSRHLGQKVALAHTAKTTSNGKLAHGLHTPAN